MSGEQIIRRCDCHPCPHTLGEKVHGSPHAPGAFCSGMCAGHAGGPAEAAKREHAKHGDPVMGS